MKGEIKQKEIMMEIKGSWIKKRLCWALIGGVVMLAAMAGCGSVEEDTMWAKLSGSWETDDPRYEGCFLEFSRGMIIFHNPYSAPNINYVDEIERKSERSQTYYVIHYRNQDDLRYSLPIYYVETSEGGKILYKNRKNLAWTRSAASRP